MLLDSHPPLVQAPAAIAERVPVQLRVMRGRELAQGIQVWRQLQNTLPSTPLACSADWTNIWLGVYADSIPSEILIAQAGERVVGCCLVTQGVGEHAGPIPIRTLHIGSAGEREDDSACVEYNGLLCEDGRRLEVAAAVQSYLYEQHPWDEIHWDGFAEADFKRMEESARPDDVNVQASRYFDLREARQQGSDVISLLGSSTRQNLRRRIRQLGTLQLEWADSLATAHGILDELTTLHQARWTAVGRPGAFGSPRFAKFQRGLIDHLWPLGKVAMVRLRTSSQTVGCLLLLIDNGRLLDYVSGFADFEQIPSAGLITHYLCQEEALRRGYDAYDFLAGDKRHKENLSTHTNHLVWAVHRRPSFKNRAIRSIRRLKHWWRSRKARSHGDADSSNT